MPSAAIKDKQSKLETIRIRARTIIAEHEKTGLPPEQDLAVTTLLDEAKKLQDEINTETKLDEKKRDLEDLDRFMDDPRYKVPHGVNGSGDPDERKALVAAGWEFKNGMCFKQTSLG